MASVSAIYCLKSKKERRDVEKYRNIVNLINRQSEQSSIMLVEGLFEAVKSFRCTNFDRYGRAFRIEKGEYFLIVSAKDYDTNHWRLQRSCRSEEERHDACPLVGLPDPCDVYSADDNSAGDQKYRNEQGIVCCDCNKYFRYLFVDLPEADDEPDMGEDGKENYICLYHIREAAPTEREDLWGITPCTADGLAGNLHLQAIFRKAVQCRSGKDLKAVENISLLTEYMIKFYEDKYYKNEEIPVHHSLVIGIINGNTEQWQCGVWCYKAAAHESMRQNFIDIFSPSGYECDDTAGLIPVFDEGSF